MEESEASSIHVGGTSDDKFLFVPCSMLNRHGLIAGATGTGKTVTLQVLSEQLSEQGISVFAADVKGDLSGLVAPGAFGEKIQARLNRLNITDLSPSGSPVAFWDIYGKKGVPLRTTISEVGPLLFAHILELNEVQTDVLHLLFQFADEDGLLLLELEDLISLIQWVADHREDFTKEYGHVAPQTLSAIIRRLRILDEGGGDLFFGEPAFQLADLFQKDFGGRGVIHLLEATDLMQDPRLYSAFLVWILSELFEQLEERGDQDKPRLVFFFDEAHLLFTHGSKALIEKFELVVRLIRSKGVGIFFVTQNPLDIPETVRGQLGAKVIHALRAFTPKDQKAVKVLSDTFVRNPNFDTAEVIPNLSVGEALVSTLNEKGVPSPVQQTLIRPPASQIGPVSDAVRKERTEQSPFYARYNQALDRESAFEVLRKRTEEELKKKEAEEEKAPKGRKRQSIFESFLKSIARSIGSQVGRQIIRGVLGSMSRR